LQKQISSYLRKLERGWGKKEKETKVDQVMEGGGLKRGAPSGEMEVGLGLSQPIQIVEPIDKPTRQHIINRYHKIYVRRNPPRQQVHWRPIKVGRKDQPSSKELPEECRSGTTVWVGDIQVTKEADRNGGQSRSQKMGASQDRRGGDKRGEGYGLRWKGRR
jgi:hypothetical protein